MTAPLSARGRRFGAITLVTAESGRVYDERDMSLATELGKRAGLAIDNALLFRAEREAADRVRLLSEASEALGRSLDHESSFHRLAGLVAGRLTDMCIIDVVEDDGTIRRVTALHHDPSKQALADVMRAHPPSLGNRDHPVVRALATGEPQHGELKDDLIRLIGTTSTWTRSGACTPSPSCRCPSWLEGGSSAS